MCVYMYIHIFYFYTYFHKSGNMKKKTPDNLNVCVLYISKVSNPKAPFSIATTSREGITPFPGLLHYP